MIIYSYNHDNNSVIISNNNPSLNCKPSEITCTPRLRHKSIFQPRPPKRMKVVKSTQERYALTNYVVANVKDFSPHTRYILVNHRFVFSISFEDNVRLQEGCLGFSLAQRRWIKASINGEVEVQPYYPGMDGSEVYISTVEVEVGLMIKDDFHIEIDTMEVERAFINVFNNQVLSTDQELVLDVENVRLIAIPKMVELADFESVERGMSGPYGEVIVGRPGYRGVLKRQTQIQIVMT